jgi:hypothetical protein
MAILTEKQGGNGSTRWRWWMGGLALAVVAGAMSSAAFWIIRDRRSAELVIAADQGNTPRVEQLLQSGGRTPTTETARRRSSSPPAIVMQRPYLCC